MLIEVSELDENEIFFDIVRVNPSSFITAWIKKAWNKKEYGSIPIGNSWNKNYSIVQFWDSDNLPEDVKNLVAEWRNLVPDGCHKIYSDVTALEFIKANFSNIFVEAYEYCYHPAVKADYFRLAYLLVCGGFYVDADLKPYGILPNFDFEAHTFLCCGLLTREAEKDSSGNWVWLTADDVFRREANDAIAYLNNDLIACAANNPIIRIAFMKATKNLLDLKKIGKTGNPHTYTGPNVLSMSASVHLISAAISRNGYSDLYFASYGRISEDFTVSTIECNYKLDDRGWMSLGKKNGFDLN